MCVRLQGELEHRSQISAESFRTMTSQFISLNCINVKRARITRNEASHHYSSKFKPYSRSQAPFALVVK